VRALLTAVLAVLVLAAPARAEDRLDRAAEGLKSSPLYVHPELSYRISERDRELIVQHLREANVPYDVKIVALPSVESDESGGDSERMLWAIDDRLYETPRLLIAVDQRGTFALVKARLKRDLEVPFEIEYGREESKRLVVPRLRAVFQLAAAAPSRDYVYQRDRPTEPLDPLPEDRPDEPDSGDDDDDERSPTWLMLLSTGIAGLLVGWFGWLVSLFVRWARGRG
jgi:hypothetical protein